MGAFLCARQGTSTRVLLGRLETPVPGAATAAARFSLQPKSPHVRAWLFYSRQSPLDGAQRSVLNFKVLFAK